jgi:hypothetical protein
MPPGEGGPGGSDPRQRVDLLSRAALKAQLKIKNILLPGIRAATGPNNYDLPWKFAVRTLPWDPWGDKKQIKTVLKYRWADGRVAIIYCNMCLEVGWLGNQTGQKIGPTLLRNRSKIQIHSHR